MLTVAAIELYTIVLFLHVLGAIAFLGPQLVMLVTDATAGSDAGYWRLRRVMGRIISFGGLLVLLAGIYLAADTSRFSEWWVSFSIVVLVVVLGVGGAYLSPTERRIAASLDAGESPAATISRARGIGAALAVASVIVLFLMVTQPS